MFTVIIIAIHVIVCVTLVLIILLQTGKGADIGAVFGGGGSQTLFGSSGATTFLSKVTIAAAVTFMLTSITLTYFAGRSAPVERSIMTEQTGAGAKQTAQPAPTAPTEEGNAKTPAAGSAPETSKADTAGKSAAPAKSPQPSPAAKPSKAPKAQEKTK
jgi:preprotein translocase subunit SecG